MSVRSMAEKLVKSRRLAHRLSQSTVDAMFPSSVMLLPPDIARQLGLDAQNSQSADVDTYAKICSVHMMARLSLRNLDVCGNF